MKLKLDQENRKKKSLMNVSKKAQTEKPKTSLEKQIEMNRKQSSLRKMKSKFFSLKKKNSTTIQDMSLLKSYRITKTNYAPNSNGKI